MQFVHEFWLARRRRISANINEFRVANTVSTVWLHMGHDGTTCLHVWTTSLKIFWLNMRDRRLEISDGCGMWVGVRSCWLLMGAFSSPMRVVLKRQRFSHLLTSVLLTNSYVNFSVENRRQIAPQNQRQIAPHARRHGRWYRYQIHHNLKTCALCVPQFFCPFLSTINSSERNNVEKNTSNHIEISSCRT